MAKILVIEDSVLTRKMLKGVLKEAGHEVIEASNGKIGCEMLEEHQLDCIILDHLMPEMDGMKFLENLKKRESKIPVIVFSADVQDWTADAFKELGAFEYIKKTPKIGKSPEKEKFLAIIQKTVGSKKSTSIETAGKTKLLVIDDSLLTRNMLAKVLENAGYEVIEAFDGEMGLQMVEEHHPDCIILDHIMPKMDGMVFLKSLRKQGNQTPVVVYTANIQDWAAKIFKELGAFEFVKKTPKIGRSPEKEKFLSVIDKAIVLSQKQEVVTSVQIDTLGELINIGMGRAAATLNDFLESYIALEAPRVVVLQVDDISQQLNDFENDPMFSVSQNFDGAFSGKVFMMFPPQSATALVSALTGEPEGTTELDSVRAGTLCEVGNILMNNIIGAICNVLEVAVNFGLPSYLEKPVSKLLEKNDTESKARIILMVKTNFTIESLKIEGSFLILLDTETFDNLLSAVDKLAKREKRQK